VSVHCPIKTSIALNHQDILSLLVVHPSFTYSDELLIHAVERDNYYAVSLFVELFVHTRSTIAHAIDRARTLEMKNLLIKMLEMYFFNI